MSDITDERMATALERIADALERAHPAKFNPGGLVQPPWNIASVPNRVGLEPVPNQPGVFRRVTHAAWDDCETGGDALCLETGEPVPVHVTVTNRWTGATLFAGDMAKLPADLDLPQGGWSADDLVQPMADPLDESDHRPRHFADGMHLTWRETCRHWHTGMSSGRCDYTGGPHRLSWWQTVEPPLTFCDCPDDAIIEAENGATD